MKYYPVCLEINNKKCLVVGGGAVGSRKVENLLKCGAHVTVISHEFAESLREREEGTRLVLEKREYTERDLEGKFLVIGATDDMELNRRISRDAEKRNMLCNIADFPEACNFILPSIVSRGDLTISISTSGQSPAFARQMRLKLQEQFGPEYAEFLELMGAIRKKLLAEKHEPEAHKPLFEQILAGDLLGLIAEKNTSQINRLLLDVLGEGFVYEELITAGDEA